MKALKGIALSPGYAEGRALVYGNPKGNPLPLRNIRKEDIDPEVLRFEEALEKSSHELEELKRRVIDEIGKKEAEIFDAHLVLLNDHGFINKCKKRIRRDLVCVEHALDVEVRDMENILAAVESEYIRERRKDIRDIGSRVLRHLGVEKHIGALSISDVPPGAVLVAHDLLPSDTVLIDREHVVGIVSERGGPASHTAILARAMGIPYVTKVPGLLNEISDGDEILVNATVGSIVLSPNKRQRNEFRKREQEYVKITIEAEKENIRECITSDGTRIELLANIAREEDTIHVKQHHLDGIGLFRTELLFVDDEMRPTLRKHIAAYSKVVDANSGNPTVIRTLDLGGDKTPHFLNNEASDNPALGLRGLRFSISEGKMLRTQLRAILRVSRKADVRILLPMVLGASDCEVALNLLRDIAAEEGIDSLPKIGAMVETPAAVLEIEHILDIVDFISIGTNDLTQFVLAADRGSSEMVGEYSILHPAVLRAIDIVISAANRANRPLTICGEAAGDPATACLFVGMGVRSLSMSPVRAARVRRLLRAVDLNSLLDVSRRALSARTATEIQDVLLEVLSRPSSSQGLEEVKYEFTD